MTKSENGYTNSSKLRDCSRLPTQADKSLLVELLLSYWDCLSYEGEFGHTTLMQHEIHTEEVPPVTTRYRPVNPVLLPDLKKQIDKLLKQDVIEPSSSPWSFALVAAPEKDGKIRWCVDYRRLNAVTRKDTFPLPHTKDNLLDWQIARYSAVSMVPGPFMS